MVVKSKHQLTLDSVWPTILDDIDIPSSNIDIDIKRDDMNRKIDNDFNSDCHENSVGRYYKCSSNDNHVVAVRQKQSIQNSSLDKADSYTSLVSTSTNSKQSLLYGTTLQNSIRQDRSDVAISSSTVTDEYLARLGIIPSIPSKNRNNYSVHSQASSPLISNSSHQDGVYGVPSSISMIYGPTTEHCQRRPGTDTSLTEFYYDPYSEQNFNNRFSNNRQYQSSTTSERMMNSKAGSTSTSSSLIGIGSWDFLLDWTPEYRNLAPVFKEIAKLKVQTNSVEISNDFSMKSNFDCISSM